jgi:hypothetical protein
MGQSRRDAQAPAAAMGRPMVKRSNNPGREPGRQQIDHEVSRLRPRQLSGQLPGDLLVLRQQPLGRWMIGPQHKTSLRKYVTGSALAAEEAGLSTGHGRLDYAATLRRHSKAEGRKHSQPHEKADQDTTGSRTLASPLEPVHQLRHGASRTS